MSSNSQQNLLIGDRFLQNSVCLPASILTAEFVAYEVENEENLGTLLSNEDNLFKVVAWQKTEFKPLNKEHTIIQGHSLFMISVQFDLLSSSVQSSVRFNLKTYSFQSKVNLSWLRNNSPVLLSGKTFRVQK